MNFGTTENGLQELLMPATPDDWLRGLLAIGRACAAPTSTPDLAREVARLAVRHGAGVRAAAVYRAEGDGRRAVLLAGATGGGPAFAATRELAQAFEWPDGDGIAAELQIAPDTPAVGWLLLRTDAAPDTACTLFAQAAAQALAGALARVGDRERARARSDALSRRESALAASLGEVSNGIRTPLTLLLGPLEAAVERHGDSGLRMALRHGQRLRRLVDSLLELTNIDTGRVDPVLQPIDVAAMTTDIASLFHGAATAAGVALLVDCPTLPQPVHVDRHQWEQVVINLVGNAIKFTGSGEVRVSLRSQVGLMTLEVADTGHGIPASELPHIFDRFHRSPGREDSGLGLALVRELVHLHGGDVEASSVPGQGSRFRVCIPMLGRPGRAAPHRRVADLSMRTGRGRPLDALGWPAADAASSADAPAVTPEPAAHERIVLVADHRDLREYVAGLLRNHYHVRALADAAEALGAIVEDAPDLVVVDLGNPARDGLAFLRALRASPAGAVMPAVLLSSDTQAFAHADAIEAGADDIVGKPFIAAELLARVGAQMRLSADRRVLHRQLAHHNRDLEEQVARRTEALAASEAQFKAISNLVPDILWRTDALGEAEWRSEQWLLYTGDANATGGMDFVHPDDRADTQAWVRETVAGRQLAPHEYRLRRSDGAYRWFIARMSPLAGPGGEIQHWFGSATDIERHQLARHALEARVDERTVALAHANGLQQELLHRLARSQEDERRRIARELHDSLGQYLTALKLALSALAPLVNDPALRDLVAHLDALTTEVDRELDDIIAALRPVVLDELGLAGALPVIVADWSRQTGIAAEALLLHVDDERFDDESESTLYRVTQESLTNVLKHAHASNVAVTLTRRQDELHLTVEDDGVGFDVNRNGPGWGLRGMAERARGAGGLLQIESAPNGGTTVLVRLPCRPRVRRAVVETSAG